MLRPVAFLVPLLLASTALAGNHCNVQAVQLQSGLVVTPFAVPVASPVAVANVSPFVYGFQSAGSYAPQSAAVKAQSTEDALVERLAAKLAAKLGLDVKPLAVPETPSLISATCVSCHGPTKQGGGIRFDQGLTDELRLQAVAAMMLDDGAKRMPKGKAIDAVTLGKLIQEFTTKPKAQVKPEALPEPPK